MRVHSSCVGTSYFYIRAAYLSRILACYGSRFNTNDIYLCVVASSVMNTTANLGNGGRFQVTSEGLTINPAEWRDSGVYTCRANNSLGTLERKGHITVYSTFSTLS